MVSCIGLYYLTTRFYDYTTGRFLNADVPSICFDDGLTLPEGCNLYSYCHNNPISYVDPSGHSPKWWQAILIGIGIVVGAALVATAITFTGGTAAAFFGAWGTAALGGLKVAAVAGGTAGVIRAGATAIRGGSIGDVGKSFVTGFADGFFAGSVYAGSSMILSASAFRVAGLFNNGYGWSAGKWIGGYQTPRTPGISLLTYLGGINGGRSFGLDLDIYNGLHFHSNKFGSIKKHRWMFAPLMIGFGIGFSTPWSTW